MISTFDHAQINDFFQQIREAKTLENLHTELKSFFNHLMLENFSIVILDQKNGQLSEECAVFDTYPQAWKEFYLSQRFYDIDPVLQTAQNSKMPFCWHIERFADLSPQQHAMLTLAHDHRINYGTTLPLILRQHRLAFITFLSCYIVHPQLYYFAIKGASLFIERKQTLEQHAIFQTLTPKEKTVLVYKAKGYGIKQVSQHMHIADPTVIFHLKNIRRKLSLMNTEQVLYHYGLYQGQCPEE